MSKKVPTSASKGKHSLPYQTTTGKFTTLHFGRDGQLKKNPQPNAQHIDGDACMPTHTPRPLCKTCGCCIVVQARVSEFHT